jgi:hypothetical protein
MVAGSGQQPCGPGPDHLGSAWPKKGKGYVGPRSAQPKVPGLGPAHIFNIILYYNMILKKRKIPKKISKIL